MLEKGVITELIEQTEDPAPVETPHPSGDGLLLVLKQGYSASQVPGPKRAKRGHTFHDLGSFADYMNRRVEGEDAADVNDVEILVSETSVVALLDPSDPNGDRIHCQLIHHPQFSAWLSIFGKRTVQRDLYLFLRGNLPSIHTPENGMDGAMIASEVRKLQVVATTGTDFQLDERGFYTVASATATTDMKGRIPSKFEIYVPIFQAIRDEHDAERQYMIEVLLQMEPVGDQWAFNLACPALPIILHQARLDAVEYLKRILEPGFLVGLGEAKTETVPDIRRPVALETKAAE